MHCYASSPIGDELSLLDLALIARHGNCNHSRSQNPAVAPLEQAAKGQPFIIAKAGKPLVKVTAIDTPPVKDKRRLGFMAGLVAVPDDFDRMGQEEIERLFEDR